MNYFVLVSLVLALSGEYLAGLGFPRILAYAPELSAMLAAVLFVAYTAREGLPEIRTAYFVVLTLLALHVLFGAIANHVQVGTFLVGSRLYLRAIPFFLLALAAPPKSNELTRIVIAAALLGLAQLPIAINQRLATMARDTTVAKYLTTGDLTFGTLMNSAFLSVFLISVAALVFAALLRKRIPVIAAIPVLLVLLVPTMINETKASLFLAPMALLIVAIAHSSRNRGRNILVAVSAVAIFTAVFIPTYDYFIKPRWGYGILDFFTMEGRVESYLFKDAEVGTTGKVSKVDTLLLPIETLGPNPVSLTLGLGLGSVTESVFGDRYTGEYYGKYGNLAGPTVSRLLWELGLLGVLLVFGLLFLIYKDVLALRSRTDTVGVVAHAWTAVVPVFLIGMFYKELMSSPGLSMFFWYLSGVIAAGSVEQKSVAVTPHVVRTTTDSRVRAAGE